jgi:hypothetical protein
MAQVTVKWTETITNEYEATFDAADLRSIGIDPDDLESGETYGAVDSMLAQAQGEDGTKSYGFTGYRGIDSVTPVTT